MVPPLQDGKRKIPRIYLSPKKRPSSKGTEKGLWVDDIAECRIGIATDLLRAKFKQGSFGTAADAETVAAKCFSLIGSECTLDLEAPSAMARDALVIRFQLWLHRAIEGREAGAQCECWAPDS
jgi:hypothetical protein